MSNNVLLIKNTQNYPLEEIITLTSLHLKIIFNFDNFIDLLEIDMSEFDAVIFEMEFNYDFEKDMFEEISNSDDTALIVVTSMENEEKAKRLTENYLLAELLTAPLLEKSVLLAIEKKKTTNLKRRLRNYGQHVKDSKDMFNQNSQIIENEFFNQQSSTRSELKWLEILLNAVPSGIIILDGRDPSKFYVNRELLRIIENEDLNNFYMENKFIRIKDISNFGLYTPDGEEIVDEEFPSIKAIMGGEDIKDLELIVKYGASGEKAVIINSSPVFDGSGNIIASITAVSDVSKLKTTEKFLINTIKAKNIISEEFNNRVLNILQTMTNLLCVNENLDLLEDYNEYYLNENTVRLSFIQKVHEKLLSYEDDKKVDFDKYVYEMCSKLLRVYNANTFVKFKIEGHASMALDVLLPCGLIISEIVSYRLKLFSKNDKIELLVRLKSEEGRITIEIIDNGPKLKIPIKMKNGSDKRLNLTHALLEQLNGLIRIETNNQQTSFFVEILYLDISDIFNI